MAFTKDAQYFPNYLSEAHRAERLHYERYWAYNHGPGLPQKATSMEVNNGESITHSPYRQQLHQQQLHQQQLYRQQLYRQQLYQQPTYQQPSYKQPSHQLQAHQQQAHQQQAHQQQAYHQQAYQQQPHASGVQGPNPNAFTAPDAAENSSALQQQIPGEPIGPENELEEEEGPPVKRGRGYTGKPKGRPPGSKNKPKVPDDGLPKKPKKKGRPPGSTNKHPKGAHGVTLSPNAGSRVVGPNETPITSAMSPNRVVKSVDKAVRTVKRVVRTDKAIKSLKALKAPATPTVPPPETTVPSGYAQVTDSNSQPGNDAGEQHSADPLGEGNDDENFLGYAQVTDSDSQSGNDAGEQSSPATLGEGNDFDNFLGNNIPLGYAPVTDSDSQSGNDAGEQSSPATLGEGNDFDNFVCNSILRYLEQLSQSPQDLVTRLASQPPPPTPSPYPSVGGHAPAAPNDGCQYPEPPQSSDELYTPCFGNVPNFAYWNEAANIDDYNEPPPRSALVSDNDPVLAPEPSEDHCLSRIDPSLL